LNVATPATSSGRIGKLVGRARQRAFRFAPADRAPVVLRHSRIYILPTRRGLAVIATLMLMLLTSLNYALSLGLGVTFLLGGLVAAALLHTFRNLAGIEIILNMREKMSEMQRQMKAFAEFVQRELSRGLHSVQKPSRDALVRVPPPRVIRVHK